MGGSACAASFVQVCAAVGRTSAATFPCIHNKLGVCVPQVSMPGPWKLSQQKGRKMQLRLSPQPAAPAHHPPRLHPVQWHNCCLAQLHSCCHPPHPHKQRHHPQRPRQPRSRPPCHQTLQLLQLLLLLLPSMQQVHYRLQLGWTSARQTASGFTKR